MEKNFGILFLGDKMSSTSTTNPGILNLFKNKPKKTFAEQINEIRNSGYGAIKQQKQQKKATQAKATNKAGKTAVGNVKKGFSTSIPSQTSDNVSSDSSSGSGITDLDGAAYDSGASDDGSDGGSDGGSSGGSGGSSSSDGSGGTSPLLEGTMTFEEMIGDICNGIDLIFATKRSTVVVTDYEGIYAEAKYLRDHNHEAVKNEDISLWQLEEGTYELDVSEYGFYNTVNVHYKNGTVTESYEDLVRVYGVVKIDYYEEKIDKTTAIMKAKAYLAAHVRDFDMSVKANILWDGDIDVGDIVTIENPLTMRDEYRTKTEKRDPEYYFVMGKSVEWEGDTPITGTLELRYGAKSPEGKEVPETGVSYSKSDSSDSGSSDDIKKAINEVGKMAEKISYSGACQTHDCVKSKKTGDCHGMSDFIACELKSRGVDTQIKQYATSYVGNHRSVLYKDTNGKWVSFPYRSFKINQLFRDTSGVKNGSNINSTC